MTNQDATKVNSLEILVETPSQDGKYPASSWSTNLDEDQNGSFPPNYFISRSELFLISFFNFPYGLICGTMALCILPAEAARLTPFYQSWTLGFFLGIVGLSQLVCPLIGKISDRYEARTPFGQRIPFYFFGAILASMATLMMWISSLNFSLVGYSVALLTGMCGLNICSSIQTGLIPSFVDRKRSGEASGVGALGTLTGASTGFGIMAICNRFDFHFVYSVYACLLISALAITIPTCAALDHRLSTCLHQDKLSSRSTRMRTVDEDFAQNDDSDVYPIALNSATCGSPNLEACDVGGVGPYRFDDIFLSQSKLAKSADLLALLNSYYLPFNDKTRDFFWVFIGRTMYYVAVSVQAFTLYYLRDVVNTKDESKRMIQVGIMALTAQACAASVAYPLGRSIDTMEMSRKLLMYLSCFVMSLCYLMLLVAPIFGSYALHFVWLSAIVYGIGNGCFLAVDYSIALTTLPDKSKAAQSLGIWGLSAFLGSALGPLLWGFSVQVMGGALSHAYSEQDHSREVNYSYWGYFCMLIGGILATMGSAASASTLRSVD